jgi:hypothetical protein
MLVAFAVYFVSIVIRASFFSDGHGPVFWTAIGVFVLLAVSALWGANRFK